MSNRKRRQRAKGYPPIPRRQILPTLLDVVTRFLAVPAPSASLTRTEVMVVPIQQTTSALVMDNES